MSHATVHACRPSNADQKRARFQGPETGSSTTNMSYSVSYLGTKRGAIFEHQNTATNYTTSGAIDSSPVAGNPRDPRSFRQCHTDTPSGDDRGIVLPTTLMASSPRLVLQPPRGAAAWRDEACASEHATGDERISPTEHVALSCAATAIAKKTSGGCGMLPARTGGTGRSTETTRLSRHACCAA